MMPFLCPYVRLRAAFLCLIFLAGGAASCAAQRYTFRTWGASQGLRNLNVVSMMEDRSGFLWLGTDNGLFRYDGARFLEFSTGQGLRDPYVVALAEDATGRLWAGTSGGLFYLDGGRFAEVRSAEGSLSVGLDGSLTALKNGHLLAVSRSRLFEIAPNGDDKWSANAVAGSGDFRSLDPSETITSVLADRDDRIWFGCGKNVCEVHGSRLTRWDAGSGVPQDDWLAFYEDHNGNIWVRSTAHVVELGNGASRWEDRTGSSGPELANNYYVSFGETAEGDVITPSSDGVAVWRGGAWQLYGPQQGFSHYDVESLFTDHHGMVWIGEAGHGLARWLGYGQWENWTIDDGLGSPIVWAVLRDDNGRVWVAHDKGISVSDPQRKSFTTVAAGLTLGMTVGLTKDRTGKIWAVTNSGVVARIQPGTMKAEKVGTVASGNQIYADGMGHIWISTEHGLYEIDSDAKAGAAQKVTVTGLDRGNVNRVTGRSDGTVWAASEDGLFVREGDIWKRVSCTSCEDHGAVTRQITDMDFASDGSLWAAINFSRVVRFSLRGDRIVSVEWMGSGQVSSLSTQFVRFDRQGRLWVGHDRGVDVFDGQRWRLLTSADGLLWNDTDNKAFWADSDGTVWIGTSEGISRFTGGPHNTLPEDAAPTRPTIEIPAAGEVPEGGNPELPWSRAPLKIRFAPLNFGLEGKLSYEYELEGEDSDWVQTTEAETQYSRLSPGEYVFSLRTIDDTTHRESPVAEMTFTVLPNWWQTWAFRLLLALLAAGLLAIAWRLRVRHLLRRQQELEVLVAARTHELEQQATHDDLTGLLNHKGIIQMLMVELERAKRQRLPLAVVLADLDFFKEVNDKYGHLAGDSVLREMGARLQSGIRVYDKAGRYGGEEFLLLMPTLGGVAAMTRIEELRLALAARPYEIDGSQLSVTCSFGVVLLDGHEEHTPLWSPNEALAAADRALYRAKNNGRDRVEYAATEATPPMK
ncbi:ligand-binding sensor domain-containing diguanylate cyclase [Paracidobacterium acidisoli]|nr:ligand-binding sensor domain-containing diguanylate cyclase [Paracidobacterium acidisoli]MBT9332064.1 diguanylate cyclase [Paracidobacterium acidisoli]